MKEETARELKGFQSEAKEITQNLKAWQAAVQRGDLTPAKKELFDEKIIDGRRRLEDLDRQARVKLGKTQDAKLTELWKDIRRPSRLTPPSTVFNW